MYKWKEIKTKYETGRYSIAELSREYGFSERYGQRKAKKEKWKSGKSSEEFNKKVTEKVMNSEAEKVAAIKGEYMKIIRNIRRATANELFNGNTNFNRLKELKISTEILRNCRLEDWAVREIESVVAKEKARLEMEIKKVELETIGKGGGNEDGIKALAKAISESAKQLESGD